MAYICICKLPCAARVTTLSGVHYASESFTCTFTQLLHCQYTTVPQAVTIRLRCMTTDTLHLSFTTERLSSACAALCQEQQGQPQPAMRWEYAADACALPPLSPAAWRMAGADGDHEDLKQDQGKVTPKRRVRPPSKGETYVLSLWE